MSMIAIPSIYAEDNNPLRYDELYLSVLFGICTTTYNHSSIACIFSDGYMKPSEAGIDRKVIKRPIQQFSED